MIFDRFVGIDWSGARGKTPGGSRCFHSDDEHPGHPSIAVAEVAAGKDCPVLVSPEGIEARFWTRQGVMNWLVTQARMPGRIFVGIDAGFAFPFMDKGLYFPQRDRETAPSTASELWSYVENICRNGSSNMDLYGGAFAAYHKALFHRPHDKGGFYERRLRVSEHVPKGANIGHMESLFHLIGPSQVGLGALAAMRMLNRLQHEPGVHIWPFDGLRPAENSSLVIAEVFATQFVRLSGRRGKVRTRGGLDHMVRAFGCDPARSHVLAQVTDHMADAFATALGLRACSARDCYWRPRGLSDKVRRTEGWVYGILD